MAVGRISVEESQARQLAAQRAWLAAGRCSARMLFQHHPEWALTSLQRWIRQWKKELGAAQAPSPPPVSAPVAPPDTQMSGGLGLAETARGTLFDVMTRGKTENARISASVHTLALEGHVPPKRGTPPPTDGATLLEQYEEEARALAKRLSDEAIALIDYLASPDADTARLERWAAEVEE